MELFWRPVDESTKIKIGSNLDWETAGILFSLNAQRSTLNDQRSTVNAIRLPPPYALLHAKTE